MKIQPITSHLFALTILVISAVAQPPSAPASPAAEKPKVTKIRRTGFLASTPLYRYEDGTVLKAASAECGLPVSLRIEGDTKPVEGRPGVQSSTFRCTFVVPYDGKEWEPAVKAVAVLSERIGTKDRAYILDADGGKHETFGKKGRTYAESFEIFISVANYHEPLVLVLPWGQIEMARTATRP